MLEMKEIAFICNNATSRSLILLDELGRATSNEDGVAIAWAVAENLLAKGAMTFFVTHYPQLCQMSKVYPSVQNQHLKASMSGDGEGEILYSHKIASGPCDAASNYGVDMAVSCGWPSDVVKEVRFSCASRISWFLFFSHFILYFVSGSNHRNRTQGQADRSTIL